MVASKIKKIFGKISPKKTARSRKTNTKEEELFLAPKDIAKIEKTIGYAFINKALLVQSLTHPSFLLNSRHQLKNNQRLEFLGDSVIQLALTEKLFDKHKRMREGKLTSIRARFACGEYMAGIARRIKLNKYLILKPRERDAGVQEQDSALADAFEALIGAVYLDSDYKTSLQLILKLYQNLDTKDDSTQGIHNPKGKLQELIQSELGNDAIRYETTDTQGDPHNRVFEVTIYCQNEPFGIGKGRTKKEAAEKAAIEAIEKWTKKKA